MGSKRSSFIMNTIAACLIVLLMLMLASCGGGGGGEAPSPAADEPSDESESTYDVPEFRDAVYEEDEAEGNDEGLVDLSGVDEGYFALVCNSDVKIKLQVFKDDEVYTYDVVCGKEQVFPLQMGNGTYTIKVMKNIVDTKYSELYCCTADVYMEDEFDPFLRPSQYADYDESSDCVKKASELAASAADANDFITGVCFARRLDAEEPGHTDKDHIRIRRRQRRPVSCLEHVLY